MQTVGDASASASTSAPASYRAPRLDLGSRLATVKPYAPGLLLAGALAGAAICLAQLPWLASHGISALTLAIVLGMLLGNTFYPRLAQRAAFGVDLSKQTLLRAGIVLYGLRLTFQDVAQVGIGGVLIDALVLGSTFGLAWFLGTRVFGLDRKTAMLIGAGSSICGAAAVMATGPVVKARADQVAVAVSTVVVFGTMAIFLYPALYQAGREISWLALSPSAYGLYAGSTIHEVAQVVAAGRAIGEDAANTAVIAKMVRVMMLAPFLLLLSGWLAREEARESGGGDAPVKSSGIVIPWFAVGFVAMTGFNSLNALPASLVQALVTLDTALLAMAMAALGLTTHVSAIRRAGPQPLMLAALLFAWLIIGGRGINHVVGLVFG